MKATPRRRRAVGTRAPDPSQIVTMLMFEAAESLMALPVSEVTGLLAVPGAHSAEEVLGTEAWVDLDEYFTGGHSVGPWLHWMRGPRSAWLRVTRVVEVLPCSIQTLAPIPAAVRASRRAGAFWAAGVRGDEVFLLMDPAKLEDARDL